MSDTILLQRDGPIATVVLNRPEKLNALTRSMWQRLGEAIVRRSPRTTPYAASWCAEPVTRRSLPATTSRSSRRERANVEQARAYGRTCTARWRPSSSAAIPWWR